MPNDLKHALGSPSRADMVLPGKCSTGLPGPVGTSLSPQKDSLLLGREGEKEDRSPNGPAGER